VKCLFVLFLFHNPSTAWRKPPSVYVVTRFSYQKRSEYYHLHRQRPLTWASLRIHRGTRFDWIRANANWKESHGGGIRVSLQTPSAWLLWGPTSMGWAEAGGDGGWGRCHGDFLWEPAGPYRRSVRSGQKLISLLIPANNNAGWISSSSRQLSNACSYEILTNLCLTPRSNACWAWWFGEGLNRCFMYFFRDLMVLLFFPPRRR